MNSPQYTIQKVSDFLEIEPHHLETCLADFRSWLHTAKQEVAEPPSCATFTWSAGASATNGMALSPATSLHNLGLRAATVEQAMAMGVRTLADFATIDVKEFSRRQNIGPSTLRRIQGLLGQVGLRLP